MAAKPGSVGNEGAATEDGPSFWGYKDRGFLDIIQIKGCFFAMWMVEMECFVTKIVSDGWILFIIFCFFRDKYVNLHPEMNNNIL